MTTKLATENPTPLFLLSPPLPAKKFRREFWGSLVLEPIKPSDNYSSHDKRSPIDMIPDIDPEPQTIKDYSEIISWSKGGGTEATVESFIKAYLRGSESLVDFRESTFADWYYMTAPEAQLEKLLCNDEWAKDALEFIGKHKPKELFFVTAILVVRRLHTGRAKGADLEGGAGLAVPNPKDGSKIVGLGVDGKKTGGQVIAGTFAKPQILAIGYRPVSITVVESEKEKSFVSKIRKWFGWKPKTRLVGRLGDVDGKMLYELKMGKRMKPGPGSVGFFGEEPGNEEEKTSDSGESSKGSGEETPTAKDGMDKSPINGPIGKIAIYSPNVPPTS